MMEVKDILSHVDHTLLSQTATRSEIRKLCDDAVKYGTASVCIPACYVEDAKRYVGSRMKVCTVIGFPNGYDTSSAKAFMAADAVKNGADEIDMVINLGGVKDEKYADIEAEIAMVKAACGDKILKVIIETCFLTESEKIRLCDVVTRAKADYIKTSTGYSLGGATVHDVALLKRHVGEGVRVKASGGIHSMSEAQAMIDAGASRIGASGIVKASHEMV